MQVPRARADELLWTVEEELLEPVEQMDTHGGQRGRDALPAETFPQRAPPRPGRQHGGRQCEGEQHLRAQV